MLHGMEKTNRELREKDSNEFRSAHFCNDPITLGLKNLASTSQLPRWVPSPFHCLGYLRRGLLRRLRGRDDVQRTGRGHG